MIFSKFLFFCSEFEVISRNFVGFSFYNKNGTDTFSASVISAGLKVIFNFSLSHRSGQTVSKKV